MAACGESRRPETNRNVPTMIPKSAPFEPLPAPSTPAEKTRPPRPDAIPIDAKEAVAIAERFVRDNGYTDFVPPDLSKLQSESIERGDREFWLKMRHNSLRPLARGVSRDTDRGFEGWVVGFDYVDSRYSGHCRAVTMDEYGQNLRMEHKDFIAKYLDSGRP